MFTEHSVIVYDQLQIIMKMWDKREDKHKQEIHG
jgi:hypothetical protein